MKTATKNPQYLNFSKNKLLGKETHVVSPNPEPQQPKTNTDLDLLTSMYLEQADNSEFSFADWLGNLLLSYTGKKPQWKTSIDGNTSKLTVTPFDLKEVEKLTVTADNYNDILKSLNKLQDDLKQKETEVFQSLSQKEVEAIKQAPAKPLPILMWSMVPTNTGVINRAKIAVNTVGTAMVNKANIVVTAPLAVCRGIHTLSWKNAGWESDNMNGRNYLHRDMSRSGRRVCQFKDEKTGRLFESNAGHFQEARTHVRKLYDTWSHKQNVTEANIFQQSVQTIEAFKNNLVLNQSTASNPMLPKTLDLANVNLESHEELSAVRVLIDNLYEGLNDLKNDGLDLTGVLAGRHLGRNLSQYDKVIISGQHNQNPVDRVKLVTDVSYKSYQSIFGYLIMWGGDRAIVEFLSLHPKFRPHKQVLKDIASGLRTSYYLYEAGVKANEQPDMKNKAYAFGWEVGRLMTSYAENEFLSQVERELAETYKHGWLRAMAERAVISYLYGKTTQGFWYGVDKLYQKVTGSNELVDKHQQSEIEKYQDYYIEHSKTLWG